MTRLGLHVNSTHEFAAVVEWYRRTQAPWAIILFPDRELVDAIKGVSPKTRVIGRVVEDGMNFGNYGKFQDRTLSAARNAPSVDVWVGWNEPAPEGDDMRRLADLEIGLAKRLMDLGKGAAIGGFSTGFLEPREGQRSIEHWRRALEFIAAHPGKVWQHSHEYGGPYVQMGVQTPDGRNQFPQGGGFTGVTSDKALLWNSKLRGWLVLRYRMLSDAIAGWDLEIPWLITEFGIDNTPPRPGPEGNGFRNFMGTEWERYPAIGDYADQLYWGGWQYGHDGVPGKPGIRIDGVMIFCAGSENQRWLPFDVPKEPAIWAKALTLQERLPVGPTGETTPEPTMLTGVDVSHWQGRMDWTKAKASGVRFAFVKATEGTSFVDSEVQMNARGALEAGIPVGPYHFYRFKYSAGQQLDHFLEVCFKHEWTLPPVVDCEDTFTAADGRALRTFCEALTARYRRPIIYTGAWWWTVARFGAPQPWAAAYPLWTADYSGPVTGPTDWPTHTIHQYTSSGIGPQYGAQSDRIDLNRMTEAALSTLLVGAEPDDFNTDGLIRAARREHEEAGIHVNPQAALTKAMAADGRVPVTNEAEYGDDRVPFQVGESLTAAGAWVYWWRGGKVNRAAL